jgi:hypothetical protein
MASWVYTVQEAFQGWPGITCYEFPPSLNLTTPIFNHDFETPCLPFRAIDQFTLLSRLELLNDASLHLSETGHSLLSGGR